MGKGHAELRIAHEHAAGRLTLHLHRARRETIEFRRQVEVHDVQTFLESFDQKFRLAGFAGLQAVHVIAGAHLPVRPGRRTGSTGWISASDPPRKTDRVVARLRERARKSIRSRRQFQRRRDFAHAQPLFAGEPFSVKIITLKN